MSPRPTVEIGSPSSSSNSTPRRWPGPISVTAGRSSTRSVPPATDSTDKVARWPRLHRLRRENLDYLLENIVDPGATVSADFRMMVVAMNDGRILNGMIKARTDRTLTLQTQTESIVLDQSEIEGIKPSSSSLMADGLLDSLKSSEVRDLIGYLAHPSQVPLGTGTGGD